ncbi:MAG: hypothetical protein NUV56_02600 [Candidatus Uhrbacteria bacterium]|nr:hypothetical protein [Candidatus Uhrbacteria bacterium]
MKDGTYNILRVGMGITFAWIGILIFRNPESWGGLLQPWATGIMTESITQAMLVTAILDLIIGVLLIIDVYVWIAALVGSAHLIVVLTVVGIDDITVRDIALLTGCLALMWDALPDKLKTKFRS